MESFELLLQVIVDEPGLNFASGLEEDVAAWVRDDVHTPTHTDRQVFIKMVIYSRYIFSSWCYKVLTFCFF